MGKHWNKYGVRGIPYLAIAVRSISAIYYRFISSEIMAFLKKLWPCRRKNPATIYGKTLFIILTILVCVLIIYFQFRVNLADDSFLEVSKCPACYGTDLCAAFQQKQIALDKWPLWSHLYNAKNVYYGHFDSHRVVLKKLASAWEFNQLDTFMCSLNDGENEKMGPEFSESGCDVRMTLLRIAENWTQNPNPVAALETFLQTGKSFLAKLGIISNAITCPSRRFLATVFNSSQSTTVPPVSSISHLTTALLINPEPVLIKTFNSMSSSFPRLLGACGRVIVEEYVGSMMTHFLSSSLYLRLKIAKQLLILAHKMTFDTVGGFKYYMTDVSFDNFAIELQGNNLRVALIDVENIIVTDPQALMATPSKMPTYVNPFGGQNGHLQFSSTDLCFHPLADHNYYAVCECLLSEVPCTSEIQGGLLWGISQEIEEKWQLRSLIRSCQSGSSDRILVAHKLIKHIDEILNWLSNRGLEN